MDHPSAPGPARHFDPARGAAFAITNSHILPRTMAALVELGVFDALARAQPAKLTLQELAAAAMPLKAVNVNNLARMLRFLSTNGAIIETVEFGKTGLESRRMYELGSVGKFFVKNHEEAGSFAHLLLYVTNPILQRDRWTQVPIPEFVVGEASALEDCSMRSLNEFHEDNPAVGKIFNQAMNDCSKVQMPAILDAYRGFQNVSVLVDVGGGFGATLKAITARYPHIKGINFDLPFVIAGNPELPGVEHIGGDMFESVPTGGDAILMKWILHDWEYESSLKLLKNCWRSLPPGGKVIVVDQVIPEIINPRECDPAVFIMDMLMMIELNACERTESEFRKLGLDAGFVQVNVVCQIETAGSILEMLKA